MDLYLFNFFTRLDWLIPRTAAALRVLFNFLYASEIIMLLFRLYRAFQG